MTSQRLPSLDGLRAISILLVLATHMLPIGPKFLRLNETAGAMGMSLFFALSGFLIASLLLQNDNVIEFLIRRMARIVPLALIYSLFVFAVIRYDPLSILRTMSFLGNYSADDLNEYNSHFWSLCVEMQFYVFIAILVAIVGKRGVWLVWPLCLAVTLLRISAGAYIDIKTHLRADEILAGACVATLWSQFRIRETDSNWLLAIAVLLWFAASSPFTGPLQYLRPYTSALLLAAVLANTAPVVSRFLSSGPMQYIASISYALYVIHHATYQGWFNEGSIFDRYILKRPISFAMTFIAAHISTTFWERPWMEFGRKVIRKRRVRLAEAG